MDTSSLLHYPYHIWESFMQRDGYRVKKWENIISGVKVIFVQGMSKTNAVVICSEAAGTTLFSRFVRDRGRTGCTFMALRYSSMGEKAHLHLLAVEVYRWFVGIHSLSGRKEKLSLSTGNMVYVLLMQIKYRSYWLSLKTPIWVESLGALQRGSASTWYQPGTA